MIESFRHKGLRRLYEAGDHRGVSAQHAEKITLILSVLDAASTVEAMDLPSFRLHALTGELRGRWAVTVRANWRIVFRFDGGNAFEVDLVDYH